MALYTVEIWHGISCHEFTKELYTDPEEWLDLHIAEQGIDRELDFTEAYIYLKGT
jgi:hypothetical protein